MGCVHEFGKLHIRRGAGVGMDVSIDDKYILHVGGIYILVELFRYDFVIVFGMGVE